MQIGYIGLGKMGRNMVERLLEKGHQVIVYNRSTEKIKDVEKLGATGAASIENLVKKLDKSRIVWLMVPAGEVVDEMLSQLVPHLEAGDLVIDGGNSNYKHTQRRAKELANKKIKFMDVGVSGGPSGARNGACMMVGGDKHDFERLEPVFKDLNVNNGYGYFGSHGAGHFVKMIHNGIEYGIMQAIAEGFEILKTSQFSPDLQNVAEVWNNGSIIESRLMANAISAFKNSGNDLNETGDYVTDSGEGRWTVQEAIDLDVPAPVITLALQMRFRSRQEKSFAGQVLAALRKEFGGHEVKSIKHQR